MTTCHSIPAYAARRSRKAVSGIPVESGAESTCRQPWRGLNSRRSAVTASTRPRDILTRNVRRAVDAARTSLFPRTAKVLGTYPASEFFLDSHKGIRGRHRHWCGTASEANVPSDPSSGDCDAQSRRRPKSANLDPRHRCPIRWPPVGLALLGRTRPPSVLVCCD